MTMQEPGVPPARSPAPGPGPAQPASAGAGAQAAAGSLVGRLGLAEQLALGGALYYVGAGLMAMGAWTLREG